MVQVSFILFSVVVFSTLSMVWVTQSLFDSFLVLGVIPEDLLGIIRILAVKGQFGIADYNLSLKRLGFSSYEAADKTYQVTTSRSAKVTKLTGKAVSQGSCQ